VFYISRDLMKRREGEREREREREREESERERERCFYEDEELCLS
jgi:hypothetical protein